MKKAEEYIEEGSQVLLWMPVYYAKKLIKQAQIDTIKETVQACAEGLRQTAGQYNSDYSMEKVKIIKVADKLIKELE